MKDMNTALNPPFQQMSIIRNYIKLFLLSSSNITANGFGFGEVAETKVKLKNKR